MKKLRDVVDNRVVKNTKFNTLNKKLNNLEKKSPDLTILIHIINTTQIDKTIAKKISDVDKKIPDTSVLVTATLLNTKISEVENKIPNHDKYILLLNLIS